MTPWIAGKTQKIQREATAPRRKVSIVFKSVDATSRARRSLRPEFFCLRSLDSRDMQSLPGSDSIFCFHQEAISTGAGIPGFVFVWFQSHFVILSAESSATVCALD